MQREPPSTATASRTAPLEKSTNTASETAVNRMNGPTLVHEKETVDVQRIATEGSSICDK